MTNYVFEGLHVDYKIPAGASDEVYVASRNIEMRIGVPDTEGSLRYEVTPGAGPNELPLISFASSAIFNMSICGEVVDASWELRLGQIVWDMGKSSQVLTLSPAGTNDLYMIHLGGDALPPFGWHLAADWQAFLDGAVMSEITSGALTPATDFRIYDLPFVGRINSEVLTGSEAADSIFGGLEDDTLFGLGGNDLLYGGAGDDKLFGGDGM